jgi:hypothetical protein
MSLPIENVRACILELEKVRFSPTIIKGCLCVIAKESGFKPQMERSYSNTPNERLRLIWPSKLKHLSEDELSILKKDDIRFFDIVYSGIGGNNSTGDGWKYRGGGFNQVTFKNAYEKYAKLIGIDLINKPELINEISTASKVVAQFFKNSFEQGSLIIKQRFKTDIESCNDYKTAVQIAVNANAGWGKDKRGSETENNALKYMNEIQQIYTL